MFAGLIFRKEPFFHGHDNTDQLVRIVRVLGSDELEAYLGKYNIKLGRQFDGVLGRNQRKPWPSFITPRCEALTQAPALDFCDRLLRYDHQERPTAKEAMAHPYFEEVRALEAANSTGNST